MNHTSTPRRARTGSLVLLCVAALTLPACVHTLNDEKPPRPVPPAAALSAETHNRSGAIPAEQSIVDAVKADPGEQEPPLAAAPDPPLAAAPDPPPPVNHNHLSSAAPAFIVQAGKSRLVQLDRPVRRG